MNEIVLTAGCAAAAAALACGIPLLIRTLPPPESASEAPADADRAGRTGLGQSDVAGRPPGAVAAAAEDRVQEFEVADELEDELRPTYAEVASIRWLLPSGIVLSALAAGGLGWAMGPSLLLAVLVPLVPVAVAVAVVDAHTRLIPRRIITPATVAVAVGLILVATATWDATGLLRAAAGFGLAYAVFWAVWFINDGFGYGDVRLAGLIGLLTARVSWSTLVLGLVAAGVLGSVYALGRALIAGRRTPEGADRWGAVPLGPFLLLGAWLALIAGAAA